LPLSNGPNLAGRLLHSCKTAGLADQKLALKLAASVPAVRRRSKVGFVNQAALLVCTNHRLRARRPILSGSDNFGVRSDAAALVSHRWPACGRPLPQSL